MLRARLFLNLVPFLVILLAIGVYAVVLFSRLTSSVDATISRHHESLIALQKMGDALTRMDRQIVMVLASRTNNAAQAFATQNAIFSQNLKGQSQNPTIPRADALIQRLETSHHDFQSAAAAILNGEGLSEQIAVYEEKLLPAKAAVEESLAECRRIHHEAVLATSLEVRATGEQMKFWMVVGLMVALIISSYAYYHLGRSILDPIQALTRATREMAEDKFDQTVPVASRDELGELAGAFNRMAAQLRSYRQNTSEQILRLHRTMETTLASFPDPIFVFNRHGDIELKNPAAEELLTQLHPDGGLPASLEKLMAAARSEGRDFLPQDFKAALELNVGNEDRHFLPRIVVMRHGREDDPWGVALVLYDITRFRLMDDIKTNLVATVSHELKTPLTSVRMVLHMLLEKALGPLTSRQQDLLRTACDDAERLLRILNTLLDLARLEQGTPELQKEETAPADLIRNVVEEMNETVVARGRRLRGDVPEGLPPVSVDRHRIGHVFSNFITNAIKHAPSGSEILVRATRAEDGGVQFCVADPGPGVPEEYQSRIFDRFFRVPGQEKRGVGLGLSIAREIVLAHGGHIGVRNAPDQGSEFFFVLRADGSGADV